MYDPSPPLGVSGFIFSLILIRHSPSGLPLEGKMV